MHKRGYREVVHRAALRESTAAALLLATGWGVGGVGVPGKGLEVGQSVNIDNYNRLVMVDPFCGSGTLLIEAALMYAGNG